MRLAVDTDLAGNRIDILKRSAWSIDDAIQMLDYALRDDSLESRQWLIGHLEHGSDKWFSVTDAKLYGVEI